MSETQAAFVSISGKTKKAVILFVDKLGMVAFSSGVGVYLAEHSKLSEAAALKDAGYAAGIAAATYLLRAANSWIAKNGGTSS